MLLSTATEAEIRFTVVHDSFVRTGHLISPRNIISATTVVVKLAHDHSIFCGFALLAVNRKLCVTVAVSSLGTNLSTILLVSFVSGHHLVLTATSSPWRCAPSAGSSSRHVERLPRQVVGRVFIITCFKKVVGQATIAVEHGETRRFTCLSQCCFQIRYLREISERKTCYILKASSTLI